MNFSNEYDQYKLLDLKSAADITSTELVHEFSDDHIPCADAKINGIEVSLYYCGTVAVGALEFANESPKAREAVFEALQTEISASINSMFDYVIEELTEAVEKDRFAFETVLAYIRKCGKESSTWSEVAGYFEEENDLIDASTMTLK